MASLVALSAANMRALVSKLFMILPPRIAAASGRPSNERANKGGERQVNRQEATSETGNSPIRFNAPSQQTYFGARIFENTPRPYAALCTNASEPERRAHDSGAGCGRP